MAEKWAVVTGGGRGFGKELAIALAEIGYHLIIPTLEESGLKEVQSLISKRGKECVGIPGDLKDPLIFEKLIQCALEKNVDILVNNAGMLSIKGIEEITPQEIDDLLAVNLTIPIKITRALVPMFKKRRSGTFINLNSGAGIRGLHHHAVYAASKHGLKGFFDSLKLEVQDHQIRIMNIFPGKMNTDFFEDTALKSETHSYIPPQEVAQLVKALLEIPHHCAPSELHIDRLK